MMTLENKCSVKYVLDETDINGPDIHKVHPVVYACCAETGGLLRERCFSVMSRAQAAIAMARLVAKPSGQCLIVNVWPKGEKYSDSNNLRVLSERNESFGESN